MASLVATDTRSVFQRCPRGKWVTGKQVTEASTARPGMLTNHSLTILMPLFNEAKTIQRALRSLSQQTYTAYDVLIGDNASEDDTATICLAHAKSDSRFRVLRHARNLGAAGNFSLLLKSCKTTYFLMAAGHDEWDSNCLRHLMESITNDNRCALAYPATVIYGVDGQVIDRSPNPPSFIAGSPVSRAMSIVKTLTWCNMFYGVFRTSVFRQCRQDIRSIGPDHVILMDVALRGTIVGVSDALFYRHEPRPFPSDEANYHRAQLARLSGKAAVDYEVQTRYWRWMWEHFLSARSSASGVQGFVRGLRVATAFYQRFRPRLIDLLPGPR